MIVKAIMEFMDMYDAAIEAIFQRLNDDDLDVVSLTCQRFQRIVRGIFYRKFKNSLKLMLSESRDVKYRAEDHIVRSCQSLEAVLDQYLHIEVLYLKMYETWEELAMIAERLVNLRVLELSIRFPGYNHIFYSTESIVEMLQIAYKKELPIERLKIRMEFESVAEMLRTIAENLPQLKELELHILYIVCVGMEDVTSFRFRTLEKLTLSVSDGLTPYGLSTQSIEMFDFVELKEFTLRGLHAPSEEAIEFIVRQKNLQKLKFIESVEVTVEIFDKLVKELPRLKEIVVDVDEQLKETLKRHLANHWTISVHSEMYEKKWKTLWIFKRM